MEETKKALDKIINSYKRKIMKLERDKNNMSLKELIKNLSSYNESINILTYVLIVLSKKGE